MSRKTRNYDCKIKHWQHVTIYHPKEIFRYVRGIVLEDFPDRDFDWVLSTNIVEENWDEKIIRTNNTRYLLDGDGEHFESDNPIVFKFLLRGL